MKTLKVIHTLAAWVAILAASLYVVDAIGGIHFATTVERRFGFRLMVLADDPSRLHQTVEDFFVGLPPPRTLHKEICATRELMQRLACDGCVLFLSVFVWRITRTKKRQPGDAP
jgi:hypothetical protein